MWLPACKTGNNEGLAAANDKRVVRLSFEIEQIGDRAKGRIKGGDIGVSQYFFRLGGIRREMFITHLAAVKAASNPVA